ncbi:MBL fold metallo-hydrolase [Aquincola sp. MAHUQ-54]|uniref:MBL fold metallo-hydrolase n=1 Tax=Aquincola agrisoli TaxID=3119538 RepID=A0AAW9Q9Y2_9BURK
MNNPRFLRALMVMTIGAAATFGAAAQTIPSVPTFPNEQKDLVNAYLNGARELAGGDQAPAFLRRCILAQAYSMYSGDAEDPYLMPPIQVFDNLYWAGGGAVSAWAVKTSEGLVLIDALNNAALAADVLVAGLQKLGLNMADAKYLLITHEHGDHNGGARYLQQTYGLKVMATEAAWAGMTSANSPAKDIVISDGEDFTVGDTTFHFVATPGHTNGAVSSIFPVYDHGTKRMAGMYGGFGIPGNATNKMLQIDSLAKFAAVTAAKNVDTLLANHQTQDLSLFNHDLLRHRRALVPNPQSAADMADPHPYVVGTDEWQRFLKVQSMCVRASAARSAQVLPR